MIPSRYPVLMPDTPSEIVTEIGKSPACRRLKKELITGARFQQEYMILRQERINEANRIIESRVIEGLGAHIAEIDQEFYFQMILEYGPECWADKDFLEDTLRKNPGMRIRVHTPPRISVDGFRDKSQTTEGAVGNRAAGDGNGAGPLDSRPMPGRARDHFATVQCIEHPAAPPAWDQSAVDWLGAKP